jgi:hypothetical protein
LEALGVADAQPDEPGCPMHCDVECRRLDSLEFTTTTNSISDGVDVDEILRDSGAGGVGGV